MLLDNCLLGCRTPACAPFNHCLLGCWALALVPLDNRFWVVGLQPSPFCNIVSWVAGLHPSRFLTNVCWAAGRALALAPLGHERWRVRAKGDSQGHKALWSVYTCLYAFTSIPCLIVFSNSLYSNSNCESVTFHLKFNKPTCSPFSCSQSLEPLL